MLKYPQHGGVEGVPANFRLRNAAVISLMTASLYRIMETAYMWVDKHVCYYHLLEIKVK
jgi:hypothetical protein